MRLLRAFGVLPIVLLLGTAGNAQQCGCTDIAFVVDDTGSMGPAIGNIKASLPGIIDAAKLASGGDLRIGLLGLKNLTTGLDGVVVHQPFTMDINAAETAINNLTAWGGNGAAEISDEALRYVATGAAACGSPTPALGLFRAVRTVSNPTGCLNIAILVTDAPAAGCDDAYVDGTDDVNAQNVANLAAAAHIYIPTVLVDNGIDITSAAHAEGPEVWAMNMYASTTGAQSFAVPADGSGLGNILENIISTCAVASHKCPNSQGFWKTHLDAWPKDTVVIGGITYTKSQLVEAFSTPVRGNAVIILADQLIAAELNILNGSNPIVISDTRKAANALLTGVNLLSGNVRTNTTAGQQMTAAAAVLDTYNNRQLTPDCQTE